MAFPDLQLGVDAYCTIADVEALNPTRSYNNTLPPTRLAVATFINDAFHQMNSLFAVWGYDVPVASSNTTAMGAVGHLNALIAAANTESTRFSAGNAEFSRHARVLQGRADKIVDQLKRGKRAIPGLTRSGNFIHRKDERAPESAFDLKATNADERDPTFKKDMKF
jgi:hypothetical protein